MKTALLFSIALFGTLAYGSHTVCSSPDLYYASVRKDFGTQPPKGTVLGNFTLLAQGKLLESITYTQGLGNFVVAKYGVTFAGNKEVLSSTGNQTAGTAIYTETAIVKTLPPHKETEVLKTKVVCEKAWALVP